VTHVALFKALKPPQNANIGCEIRQLFAVPQYEVTNVTFRKGFWYLKLMHFVS